MLVAFSRYTTGRPSLNWCFRTVLVPSSRGGWFGSGSAKTYETEVRLVDEVEQLKPGMTAVVNTEIAFIVKHFFDFPIILFIQEKG